MFRSYCNTFSSEDAIQELGTLKFTKSFESTEYQDASTTTTTTTFQMSRDMAKALIQQFLWTRLITNAVEPYSKTYRDKGLWRISSKGLCVLQEFCIKTKMDIGKFAAYVDPSARFIFLIQIERLKENDRLNCKRKYISCLFAIMIASLPLRHNFSNENKTTCEDSHSICSSDSGSTASTSRNLSFSDYFPHIKTLPNDLLVGVSYKYPQWSSQKSSFQQQRALLKNLNPSSKKFKMRAIFSSLLCCNWLIEFCTVASNDEAESIMTEFLNLGWIAIYDEKYRHQQHIESSKSTALNVTREGIEVVMDVSLKHCNDIQQQAVEDQQIINRRCSTVSSLSSSNTDSYHTTTTQLSSSDEKERLSYRHQKPKTPLLPLLETSTISTNSDSSTLSTPLYDINTIPYFDIKQFSTTPPLTPTTPTTPTDSIHIKESNSIKLKMVLKDAHYRSLFRDFLESNFCAENLDFWIDYDNLRRNCRRQTGLSLANQKQLLEDAYALWEMYFQPGNTGRELNIDHTLRQEMANEITNMVTVVHTYTPGQPKPMVIISTHSVYQSLSTILNWFDKVNDQICKLMASDSIPKFIRTSEYKKAVYKSFEINTHSPSVVANDLDSFPPPPQRKLKETAYF